MSDKEISKDETFWKVLSSALELEFRKGHLKWTMTELSRKSGITRSLIYYYFGREKMDIMKAAVNIVGEEFVGLTDERMALWQEGKFQESLLRAREFYNKAPYLCAFAMSYRSKPNELGEALVQIEKAFIEKIKKFAPKASQVQLNTLYSLYFGICFSPYVGEDEIRIFTHFIQDIFSKLN